MSKKMFRDILRLILYCVLLVVGIVKIDAVIGFFGLVFSLLTPLLIGAAIAMILNRPNKKLYSFYCRLFAGGKDRAYCKGFSIVTVYLFFIAVIAAIVWIVVPQFADSFSNIAANLESYYKNASAFLGNIKETWHLDFDLAVLEGNFTAVLETFKNYISSYLTKIVGVTTGVFSALTNFIFGLIFSIYLLIDKNRLIYQSKNLLRVFLPERFSSRLIESCGIVSDIMQDYIGVRLMTGLFSGIFCFVGMTVFGFEYPLLVSVLVGVLTIVPVFGPWFGCGVCLALSLLVYPEKSLWLLLLYWVLYFTERFFVFPFVLDKESSLPPLWRIFAVSFFGAAFGFAGMLVAVPLTAFVYSALSEWLQGRENKNKKTEKSVIINKGEENDQKTVGRS